MSAVPDRATAAVAAVADATAVLKRAVVAQARRCAELGGPEALAWDEHCEWLRRSEFHHAAMAPALTDLPEDFEAMLSAEKVPSEL